MTISQKEAIELSSMRRAHSEAVAWECSPWPTSIALESEDCTLEGLKIEDTNVGDGLKFNIC